MRVDCEESNEIVKMSAKTKKAIVLVNSIKNYRQLALSTDYCDEVFGNMIDIDWELGDGDRSEWDEQKLR